MVLQSVISVTFRSFADHDRRVPESRMSGRRSSQRRHSYMFENMSGDSNIPRSERRVSKMLSGDGTESGLQTKSAIRTFFVVAALSFHSVIEGMTIGLEKDGTDVWMSFLAVSLHKFVIAFSVGVELLAAEVKRITKALRRSFLYFRLAINSIKSL